MKRRNAGRALALLAGAVLVVCMACAVTACSASEAKDKAVLGAALTKFSAASVPFGLTIQSADPNSTITPDGQPVAASLRAGRDGIADEWQKVIDAAAKVDGADAEAAAQAWADLDAAIDKVPDDATAAEAGAIVGDPLSALLQVEAELWAAVKPT